MAYVSLRTIADRLGISVNTVSVALRRQRGVSSDLAAKIREVAEEVGYRPPALLQEAMGQLKMKQATRFHSELAFCTDYNLFDSGDEWGRFWRDLKNYTESLGYDLVPSQINKMSRRALRASLRGRNIRGIILAYSSWFPTDLDFLLEDFACVLLGSARSLGLPIHFAEIDLFQAGRKAMQEVLRRGYRRVGLVRNHHLDPERLLLGGIYSVKSEIPTLSAFEGDWNQKKFLNWLEAEKPDCILTTAPDLREWLEEAGHRVPEDIGLAYLRKSARDKDDWSGINPLWLEVGKAGINKLVSMLRQGASGIPPVQECILVEGVWSDGNTLLAARNPLLYGPEPPPLISCREKDRALKCLDLRSYVNRSFTRPQGWFGDRPLLYCLPGEHEVCGTRFRILDEAVNGKSVLIMASQHCPEGDQPTLSQVDIAIGCKVKSIHILHACGWSGGAIRNFAAYRFIDAKGGSQTLRLVDRRSLSGPESDGNLQDYWPKLPPLSGRHVRPICLTAYGDAELYRAYLYILEWINPNPMKTIQTLRITSNPEAQTTLGILAITVQF